MLKIPDEIELLNFFGCEPQESIPHEGYYLYKISDDRGIELSFSFHALEGSIQVRLLSCGAELAVFCQELGREIKIIDSQSGKYLICSFSLGNSNSQAEIHISPRVTVNWYVLET